MRPTWGPSGSCRPQMGPMLAPWTLLSGLISKQQYVTQTTFFKNSWRDLLRIVCNLQINKVGPEQNDWHFANAFSWNFVAKICIMIQTPLVFVLRSWTDSKSVLVQLRAWSRTCGKPWPWWPWINDDSVLRCMHAYFDRYSLVSKLAYNTKNININITINKYLNVHDFNMLCHS